MASKLFWGGHMACRILTPQSEIKLVSLEMEARSSNHWTAREFPSLKS